MFQLSLELSKDLTGFDVNPICRRLKDPIPNSSINDISINELIRIHVSNIINFETSL